MLHPSPGGPPERLRHLDHARPVGGHPRLRRAPKSTPDSNWAGVPLMTQTVEALLGQHIDHTVMLDFQGFAAMTDALGGVDVNIKQAFHRHRRRLRVFSGGREPGSTGCRRWPLSASAMPSPTATYQRVRNQQTFLKAVMAKMAAEGGLADRDTVKQADDDGPAARHGGPGAHPGDAGTPRLQPAQHGRRATACSSRFPPPASGPPGRPVRSSWQNPAATAAVSAALSLRHPGRVRRREQAAERQLRRRSSVDWRT